VCRGADAVAIPLFIVNTEILRPVWPPSSGLPVFHPNFVRVFCLLKRNVLICGSAT